MKVRRGDLVQVDGYFGIVLAADTHLKVRLGSGRVVEVPFAGVNVFPDEITGELCNFLELMKAEDPG